MPPVVLTPDEAWGVRQQQLLTLGRHGEEAPDNGASTCPRPAVAWPRVPVEGVEAVVNGDLRAGCDWAPGEDPDAVAHRIGVAGVVQVTARKR